MTRANLLFRSVVGSVGGRVSVLIAPFLVMPAMLDYLGVREFGVWMTAIAITGFIQFADLGIGSGLLTRLSAAHAQNDMSAFRSYVASSFAALLIVAIIASLIGLICLLYLSNTLSPIYSVTLIAFAFSIPGSIIYRIFYATNRIVAANVWQVIGALLSVGVAFTAIRAGLSTSAVVFAYVIVGPLTMLAATVWTLWREEEKRPKPTDIKMWATIDLMGLGWKFFILAILTAASMNADNILIALRLGEAAVTLYAIPARIGTLLTLIAGTIAMPLWTIYGEAITSGDRTWVWRNALLMAALGFLAVAAAGAILTIGIDFILHLWMGRSFSGQHKVVAGLAIFSAVTALTAPFNMILNAAGQVKPQIVAWGLFVPLAIGMKWVLLPRVGTWVLPLVDALLYSLLISLPIFFLARFVVRSDQAGDTPFKSVS
ncbi:oligosaccharide flippase family protein [Altererythrobacter aquiaggeris]|uniref:oligosaccharide flippase family protein n=1 Tax=Aestuarierythrobacter aquiaggeris TaxID=1898396 RepID=UPI003018475F